MGLKETKPNSSWQEINESHTKENTSEVEVVTRRGEMGDFERMGSWDLMLKLIKALENALRLREKLDIQNKWYRQNKV